MTDTGFWDDQNAAKKVIDRANVIKRQITPLGELDARVEEFPVLIDLAREQGDTASMIEVQKEYDSLDRDIGAYELDLLLSGPFDRGSAFMTIHSGAGGTEACDWADMLMRMYVRWCERKGYKVQIIDHQEGDEVGTRSATSASVSGKWQAAMLPPSLGSSTGSSVRQISCAFQQRVWKRHACGGFVGDGTSPASTWRFFSAASRGSATGTADISAPV